LTLAIAANQLGIASLGKRALLVNMSGMVYAAT
jgi:hypothetical protein